MNIKDLAREAYRDQQSQDTEGGCSDAGSFIVGYLAGYRELEIELAGVNKFTGCKCKLYEEKARTILDDRINELEVEVSDWNEAALETRSLIESLETKLIASDSEAIRRGEHCNALMGKLAEAEKYSVPWIKRIGMSNVNKELDRWTSELDSRDEKLNVAVEALELIAGQVEFYCEVGERQKQAAATWALKKISEGVSVWNNKTTEQIQEAIEKSEGV